MKMTLKRIMRRYIVTVDDKVRGFKDGRKAWTFVYNVPKYGLAYTEEVYDKITCLYQLGILKKGGDRREYDLLQVLLDYRSSILMDNAVRGIIVGDYTLDQLLARKGIAV